MTNEVQFLGNMEKLTVGPNDVFVVSIDEHISAEAANRVSGQISEALGTLTGMKPKVLVLSGGMKIGAVEMPGKVAA
jgi:hypothetical protein